ncbi:MAG: hypothetical protein AABX80_02745, partial [Nanoarchaeota archaeon]
EKMRQFAKNSEHVDSLMFATGKPNCYIQIFHQNILDVHKFLIALRQAFPNELITTEILPLKNEGEDVNAMPFL